MPRVDQEALEWRRRQSYREEVREAKRLWAEETKWQRAEARRERAGARTLARVSAHAQAHAREAGRLAVQVKASGREAARFRKAYRSGRPGGP